MRFSSIPLVLSYYLVKLIPNSFWLSFCEQWFFSFLSARRTWKIMIQQSRTSINYVLTQVNKTKDKLPKQQQKISIFTDWHSYSIPVITNANKTIANKSPTCQPTLCAESNSFWLSAGHWTLRGAFTTVNFHVYHMEDSVSKILNLLLWSTCIRHFFLLSPWYKVMPSFIILHALSPQLWFSSS